MRKVVLLAVMMLLISSCKKSDDFAFTDEGNTTPIENDVDNLTITETIPNSGDVVIEVGNSQQFFASAKAPVGRTISYTWVLDGVQQKKGEQQSYEIDSNGSSPGDKTLRLVVEDGVETESFTWAVKVNGAPVISTTASGIQKVSVGSNINFSVSATDPNDGDSITYTWLLDGLPSVNLVGTDNTAVLTGATENVGAVNIQVVASDGTASDTLTFNTEVNHFPEACNTLTQNQICTYAGNPNIGDGVNPDDSIFDERIRPISSCQDDVGNIFMTDYQNDVIWYYNRSSTTTYSRLNVSVPPRTLKIVAGTGEGASGGDGVALQSALNDPRGCAYHPPSQRLFVSEWSGSRVKYIDNNGLVFGGMGYGSSTTDGDVAYNHDCDAPAGMHIYNSDLYIACRSDNMVRRWDLNTDQAYVVYGDGGGNIDGEGGDPTSAGARRPYDVYADAQGLYVAHDENHQIRFINMSGGTVSFWAGAAGTQIDVNDNTVRRIIGNGSGGNEDNETPQTMRVSNITGVTKTGNLILYTSRGNDRFYIANNGLVDETVDGILIEAGEARRISPSRGYNGTNIDLGIAQVDEPYDIQVDVTDGNKIIFSDYNNYRLREIDLTTDKMNDIIGSGKGRNGFLGDISKPSLQHLFNYPGGVIYNDTNRYLYFIDKSNNRTRAVDPYGNIQTVIGRGQGDPEVQNDVPSNAFMYTTHSSNDNMINGIDLMPDGSVIQLNTRRDSFRIWNTSPTTGRTYFNTFIQGDRISTIAGDYTASGNGGDGPALSINMDNPTDVEHYNDGANDFIYVVDQTNHCIRELRSDGDLVRVLGTCGTSGNSGPDVAEGAVLFNRPHGIAVDTLGNLIITDTYNSKIRYWNRTAAPVTVGIVTVGAGRVATIACNNGTSGSASEEVFSTSARCNRPTGIDIYNNQICFANTWRHNVRCINTTDGKIRTVAGQLEATPRAGSPIGFEQEGISGTSATLYYPNDVDFDANGDLFISDQYNHIIRKLKLSAD